MYVYSFTDFTPQPRYDGVSWSKVTIQEAPAEGGPYTLIDTINVGVDADPSKPAPRSFTTTHATLVEGWYIITFQDATGNDQNPVAPVHAEASGESQFLPTVQDVALKLLSRTRDQYGNEIGTFTEATRPTATQVAAVIMQVATDVGDMVGDDIPDFLWDDAANVIAERAAMQIELDFYPDQVNTSRSIYPQLKETYEEDLTRLQRQATLAKEGGTGTADAGPGTSPSYSFPEATSWLDRRM